MVNMVGDAEGDGRVAVIGLGLLGSAIAARLTTRYQVLGFDVSQGSCDKARDQGVSIACAPEQLVMEADVIIFSLPTSDVVASVIQPWLSSKLPLNGKLFVDTTTGRPQQMAEFQEQIGAVGADYVEACVAGSSEQLRAGEATLLLGGAAASLERAESILKYLAEKRFRLGPAGSGAKFKLVHNLVLGLNRAALAEGLAFAESLGFELGATVDVLLETPAASAAMAAKGSKMAEAEYSPQAKLGQHLKDVRLILAEAAERGLELPLSQTHQQLLELAEQLGWGEADNSAILEALRREDARRQR